MESRILNRRRNLRIPGQFGEDALEDDHPRDPDLTIRAVARIPSDAEPQNGRLFILDSPTTSLRAEQERRPSGGEDLFLNIARSDTVSVREEEAPQDAISRRERRRSRLGLPNHHQSLLQNAFSSPDMRPSSFRRESQESALQLPALAPSSPPDGREPESHYGRRSRRNSGSIGYSHISRNSVPSYAASAHPLDELRSSRTSGLSSRASVISGPRRERWSERSGESTANGIHGSRILSTSHDATTSVSGRVPTGFPRSTLPSPAATAETKAHRGSAGTTYEHPQTSLQIGIPSSETFTQLEGSVSTVSNTTAPTQVWDEMDHIRSRISQLESQRDQGVPSGTMVGGQSQTSGDRPRTATTTITTISSSPKRAQKKSSLATPTSHDTVDGAHVGVGHTNLHPLLHAALAKSRPLLSHDVYRALEVTAIDALAIAAMTGSTTTASGRTPSGTGLVLPGVGMTADRQLRRKADSLCRSLTELCITLQDAKVATPSGHITTGRSGSRDHSCSGTLDGSPVGIAGASGSPAFATPKYRGIINGGDGDADPLTLVRSSSRALSRVEARRTSLLHQGEPSPRSSMIPEHASPLSAAPAPRPQSVHAPSSGRAYRTSSVLRSQQSKRLSGSFGDTDASDRTIRDSDSILSSSNRPHSRAATEIGSTTSHHLSRSRDSPRAYAPVYAVSESLRTSNVPTQSSPSTQSYPPVSLHRRHYITTSSPALGGNGSSPLTPSSISSAPRRYLLDRGSPSAASTRTDDRRSSYGLVQNPLPTRSATGLARNRLSLTGSMSGGHGGGSVVSAVDR